MLLGSRFERCTETVAYRFRKLQKSKLRVNSVFRLPTSFYGIFVQSRFYSIFRLPTEIE